jgi:hypothetical protein
MRARSWAALFAAAWASATGCLVVTPLGDLPKAEGGTASGGSNHGGAPSAGTAPAGGTEDAGQAGEAPNGGAPNPDECRSNADCVRLAADEPARCRPSDHTCAPLKNDACPLAFGDAAAENAVYFGAFATLNRVAPEDNSIVWAHRLALDELSGDNIGGLPDGPKGAGRPLVMVVCDNADDTVEPGVKHLAEDLEVPAMIATLKPGDLRRAFESYPDVFYLSPVSVTAPVVAKEDDGHIWNLLGQPSDFAPTYVELLKLSEAHLRTVRGIEAGTPIKVALVTTKDAFDAELADSLEPVLRFNGKSVAANGDDFAGFTIGDKPDFTALAAEISAFKPDIVVSAASELFLMTGGLQQTLEEDWELNTVDDHKARPFYILSPYNAGNLSGLTARISQTLERAPTVADQERYVGVSVAAAADKTLQNAYAVRLGRQFKSAIKDTAHYYDAVYYLAYAMYGANQPAGLTGSGIADGMQRLLKGPTLDIGPGTITETFKALAPQGATLHVASTLGPPDFDAATGVRPVDGSVFCFTRQKNTAGALIDVLRYDRETHALTGKDFPCISGFYQP